MTVWTVLGGALQPILGLLDRHVPSAPKQPMSLPVRVEPQHTTSPQRVEEIVQQLNSRKTAWTRLSCRERAKLLRGCMDNLLQVTNPRTRMRAQRVLGMKHKGKWGGVKKGNLSLLPQAGGRCPRCVPISWGG